MAPGAQQTYIIYVGQSTTSPDFQPPVTLCVEGPRAALYNHGDFAPTPLPINAYIQNVTDLERFGGQNTGPVVVTLNLPKGLVLAQDSQPLSQTVPNVTPGREAAVSWRVVGDGTVTGKLTYSITLSEAQDGVARVIQRSIEIPSPTGFTARGSSTTTDSAGVQRWQMLSIPLVTGRDTPESVLGIDKTQFLLRRYVNSKGSYVSPDTFLPGVAYWFKSSLTPDQPVNLVLPTDPNDPSSALRYNPLPNQVQPNADKYLLDVPFGWSQLANPYIYRYKFSDIQVINTVTLQNNTFEEAILAGWISPILWEYNTADPNVDVWGYRQITNPGEDMLPYHGYWINVRRQNLRFQFTGVDTPGAIVTRGVAKSGTIAPLVGTKGVAANSWAVNLSVKGASTTDAGLLIGVHPAAGDGADNFKSVRPPAMNSSVSLVSVNGEDQLGVDLRSPGIGKKVWNLTVQGTKPNENVVVSWGSLATSLPREYNLQLVDPTTNTHVRMRSAASYALNVGPSSVRNLQIVAEPTSGAGRMRVLSMSVNANGVPGSRSVASVSVNYALAADGDASVVIRDGRGRVVRTLNSTTRAVSGTNVSTLWDLRDARGVATPSGLYQIEVNATSPDGQHDRQVRPFVISR